MENATTRTSLPLPSYEELSLAECEAMIVWLNTSRFVIVRPDERKDLWPIKGGWSRIREICQGEEVIYRGKRAKVQAVDVYR